MKICGSFLLLGLLGSTFVLACGAEDSTSAADSDVSGATDLCATLDYGHERPNVEHFLDFEDDAAAMTYATDWLAEIGRAPPTEITKDPTLLRIVDDVYAGFRKVFPRETEGFPSPPRIVIVKSDELNAFAGFDDRPEVAKAPWLFFVHTGIVEKNLPEAQIAGLFVHELAHLILRNTLPETRAKIRTHYRQTTPDTLGATVDDDPKIRAHADELRRLTEKVGRFSAFGPFPFALFETSAYQTSLGWFRSQRGESTDPDACIASDATVQKLMAFATARASAEEFSLRLTPADTAEMTSLTTTAKKELSRCYAHLEMPYWEARVRASFPGAPPDQLEEALEKIRDPGTPEHAEVMAGLAEPIEQKVAKSPTSKKTIEQFFEVIEGLHARIDALEADRSFPVDDLRVFDMEEDADDAAVRVLRAIGADPLANGRFLLAIMKDASACEREVAAGKEPFYGRFVDPHNATCWRYYHATKLAAALARCPLTPTRQSEPRTATPSRADKSPTQLIEKGYKR